MDMSFAGQALSAEYVAKNHATLDERPSTSCLPTSTREIARLKLEALGILIDEHDRRAGAATSSSWQQGT